MQRLGALVRRLLLIGFGLVSGLVVAEVALQAGAYHHPTARGYHIVAETLVRRLLDVIDRSAEAR